MAGQVRVEKEEFIAWVIFDHPERRNALSRNMWVQLIEALADLDADPKIRVILLRGAGEVAFVSGADISEFEKSRTGEASESYNDLTSRAFTSIRDTRKPLISMIHGFCVGGGLAVSLGTDLRYTADDGVFAIPAAKLGVGYASSGVDTLIQLVGPAVAKEIFFTGQKYDAKEALGYGFVNRIFPKAALETEVRKIASRVAANAPLTIRAAKGAAREFALPPDQRDKSALEQSVRDCFESEDYREGVRAFMEKRRPQFRGI